MHEFQLQALLYLLFPALISLSLLWIIAKWLYKPAADKNLPPSPRKLPILGNLHQLGSLPHRNLKSLAQKHGPIMLLHCGNVPVLTVSSADAAREIMKTHDTSFADRPEYKAFKKLLYNYKDVSFSPYGEYWRQMKSIFVLQLLSQKRVQSLHSVREQETALFMERITQESRGPVNLTNMLSEFTNNIISRSAIGRRYGESKRFLMLMTEFMDLLGTISIADFIPWLGWVTRVNGFDKRVDEVFRGLDDFLEGVIREHVESAKGSVETDGNGDNFIDILLQYYQKEHTFGVSIDIDSIKALILDVFSAGTDTMSAVLEWVMAELLRHRQAMKKLQSEVREIAKDKQDITEDDLKRMYYLKAVMKETLRCHPPLPLLMPRIAREDVKVKGYDVKSGTIVMINAFAIGRDPAHWDEPEKFKPERFMSSSVDYKGLDFDFVPFGAGRRGCPATIFAVATMEFVLANLVLKFDWELADGAEGMDMDMTERFGGTVRRAIPLLAVATRVK